ncbi:unnamed protein product [Orchesella dallaii]|uniref:ZAD domain-containing protein n=1 Tax=Orchesella dallaii TaxID=48710 RepID=A0ABP1RUC5_9HEXA
MYKNPSTSDTTQDDTVLLSASTCSSSSSSCSKTLCIFCAKQCPQVFTVENGKVTKTRKEMEQYSFIGQEPIVSRQLQSFFVMKNLLDITNETCQILLAQVDGQFNPEFWLPICSNCKVVANDFLNLKREIKKMEKKAEGIKATAKELISGTMHMCDPDVDSIMWNEIREEAIFGVTPAPDLPQSQNEGKIEKETPLEDKKELEVRETVELTISIAAGATGVGEIEATVVSSLTLIESLTTFKNANAPAPQSPRSSDSSAAEEAHANKISSNSDTPNSSSSAPVATLETPDSWVPRKENRNILDGYIWISGRGKSAMYECDACPAKVMVDEMDAHDFLHKQNGRGVKCKFCKVVVHFEQICNHRKYECLKCPEEHRLSLRDLRERDPLINFGQGGNPD